MHLPKCMDTSYYYRVQCPKCKFSHTSSSQCLADHQNLTVIANSTKKLVYLHTKNWIAAHRKLEIYSMGGRVGKQVGNS